MNAAALLTVQITWREWLNASEESSSPPLHHWRLSIISTPLILPKISIIPDFNLWPVVYARSAPLKSNISFEIRTFTWINQSIDHINWSHERVSMTIYCLLLHLSASRKKRVNGTQTVKFSKYLMLKCAEVKSITADWSIISNGFDKCTERSTGGQEEKLDDWDEEEKEEHG